MRDAMPWGHGLVAISVERKQRVVSRRSRRTPGREEASPRRRPEAWQPVIEELVGPPLETMELDQNP